MPSAVEVYKPDFYKRHISETEYSADKIAKCLADIIAPKSVIDIGCGIGIWLKYFKDYFNCEVFGVDGPWVDKDLLCVKPSEYTSADITSKDFIKDYAKYSYELATSIEVGGDIDDNLSQDFVNNLCHLSKVVLFSSASPNQSHKNHVNQQWPSYWIEKFANCNYVHLDCIRPKIWEDKSIGSYYKQNMLLFVLESELAQNHDLRALKHQYAVIPQDIPHPRLIPPKVSELGVKQLIQQLPKAIIRAIKKRI